MSKGRGMFRDAVPIQPFDLDAHRAAHQVMEHETYRHLTATEAVLQVEGVAGEDARHRARVAIAARAAAYQLKLRDRIMVLEARNLKLADEAADVRFHVRDLTTEVLKRELARRAGVTLGDGVSVDVVFRGRDI